MRILNTIKMDRRSVVTKGDTVDSGPGPETLRELRNLVDLVHDSEITAVDVSNVADWYFVVHPGFMRIEADFPNLAPPWEVAWYEYTFRGRVFDGKELHESRPLDGTRIAVMHMAFPEVEKAGWDVKCAVFTQYKGKPKEVVYRGLVEYLVSFDGTVVGKPTIGVPTDSLTETQEWFLSNSCAPVAMAISLTHCKNVSTVENRPPPKVAAKRRKQGKPVGITYKTLVIDGMKEVLRTEGGIEGNGLKKALHICRGHFATYTDDKPLFGKVTGTFWRPMHTRGSKKRGEVKKDYKVIAGE